MQCVRNFDEINTNDVHLAGGKGASLGEMMQVGIPVPPGFVITAHAYDVSAPSVSPDLANEILSAFDALGSPYVAVRSSATAEDGAYASWAGELETFLNTTRENLIQNIERCWASIGSDRAKAYRAEKGLDGTKIPVAVVVQQMVQSEVAGIAFTVHPVTKDRDQMIIEACWGLGEFIVGGIVTPDSYIVSKTTNGIIETYTSEQETMLIRGEHGNVTVDVPDDKREAPKLDAKQIETIGTHCIAIEKHYGFPCDIEWAMQSGKFYILQSRPITTL